MIRELIGGGMDVRHDRLAAIAEHEIRYMQTAIVGGCLVEYLLGDGHRDRHAEQST